MLENIGVQAQRSLIFFLPIVGPGVVEEPALLCRFVCLVVAKGQPLLVLGAVGIGGRMALYPDSLEGLSAWPRGCESVMSCVGSVRLACHFWVLPSIDRTTIILEDLALNIVLACCF